MSDKTSGSGPDESRKPANPEGAGEGHVAASLDSVSARAAESASKKPAPHQTPHEVSGSPVRSPADLEGSGSPGSSDEATKQLPP